MPTRRWDNPPYPHGTQATYTCRPGYVKMGRIAFRCIDGAWKQLDPVTECRNKPCGHPGDTEFGFFELTSGSEFVLVPELSTDVMMDTRCSARGITVSVRQMDGAMTSLTVK